MENIGNEFEDAKFDLILCCFGLYYSKDYKKTITEMAYIDDKIKDGSYLMTIEIPPMVLDAAPSRIFIFKLMDNNYD